MEKWNTIKFIKFEKALKKSRDIKSDVAIQVLLDHYIENKSFIKKMCVKAKIIGELEVLVENRHFFEEGDNKHLALRDFIFRKIRVREDIYKVNQFKDDDILLSLAVI